MTKLFNKFLTVSVAAFSALSLSACSDKIAGTAEEPNQIANGDGSSSSSISENENGHPTILSSSDTQPAPTTSPSSSSQQEREGYTPIKIDPTPSSSSNKSSSGNDSCSGGFPSFGTPDTDQINTLDNYLNYYGITEVAFAENVLGYNVTFKSCDASQETCFESPSIAKLRELGLHKITQEDVNDLHSLFPITTQAISRSLHMQDGFVSRTQNGCPLYVLNINDTSPAVHVLTKISNEAIAITEVHDNCDYEKRPFDMYVGFLFEYCGELSESPQIDLTFLVKETWNCRNIDYGEVIKIN